MSGESGNRGFVNFQIFPQKIFQRFSCPKVFSKVTPPSFSIVGFILPGHFILFILTRQPGIVPHLCVESHYFQFSTIYRIEFYQTLLFVTAGIFFNDGMKTNIYGIYRPFFFVLKQVLKLCRSSLKLTLRVSASSK